MKGPHLFVIAVAGICGVAGCGRDGGERARDAATDVREMAARAGDRLTDSWLTARVQARYFADESIKARYIDVTSRDGVVTLQGFVETDDLRRRARQIAGSTDGVRRVDDQVLIGQAPRDASRPSQQDAPVPTTGADATNPQPPDMTGTTLDDAAITSLIQAKYFLHEGIKARHIEVTTMNGVVTLRGGVASDDERGAALLIARTTQGVQRVEDGLSVDAALGPPPGAPPSSGAVSVGTSGAGSADDRLATSVISNLTAAQLSGITATARDGVVLLEGTVLNQAAKQQAIAVARTTGGVVQVVDRLRLQ